jgi:peptide/nickel transport system permease protein
VTAYIVRRVLWGIAMLVAVSAITFAIFYLLPSGDPAQLRAGPRASPALVASVRHELHLDDPIWKQFGRYMWRVFTRFDFGRSFQHDTSVRDDIVSRLPATISLTVGAAVLWLAVAGVVGTISALKRRTLVDRLAMGASLVVISAPVYWLGLLVLYLLADDVGRIKLLPGVGSYVPLTQDPWGWFTSLLMPWVVLAASFSAVYARLWRQGLIHTLGQDYIRTARAKGLSERAVIGRHALRGAATPLVTLFGLDLGVLLGGAILVEDVFNIPGVGRYGYDAVRRLDLPSIQGTVLFAAFFIIVMNLIVDIAYAFLDPRVRYG